MDHIFRAILGFLYNRENHLLYLQYKAHTLKAHVHKGPVQQVERPWPHPDTPPPQYIMGKQCKQATEIGVSRLPWHKASLVIVNQGGNNHGQQSDQAIHKDFRISNEVHGSIGGAVSGVLTRLRKEDYIGLQHRTAFLKQQEWRVCNRGQRVSIMPIPFRQEPIRSWDLCR